MTHATPAIVLLIVFMVGPVLYFIRRAKQGKEPYIRRIPGIDAMDEAVGRTIELGRPMSFTTGLSGVSPLLYACLGVLRYIGRKSALFNSRVLVPSSDPQALALADATLQNAYRSEKKFSHYNPEMLRYLSDDQFAFASGYQGLIHREHVGAAFLLGSFAAESLILAEAGQQIGAMQVAGTIAPEQIPFFLTTCDYTLIGEELYAAGAYLSHDPVQTGSLRGQDMAKAVLVLLVIAGTIQATYYSYVTGAPQAPLADWIRASWHDLLQVFNL